MEYIWVDAICINQDDNDERTSQVALMAGIFARSSCLLTWLGEDSLSLVETQILSDLFHRRFGSAEMSRNHFFIATSLISGFAVAGPVKREPYAEPAPTTKVTVSTPITLITTTTSNADKRAVAAPTTKDTITIAAASITSVVDKRAEGAPTTKQTVSTPITLITTTTSNADKRAVAAPTTKQTVSTPITLTTTTTSN
ncbi:hypothetical protein LTR85_004256 [Meristemomyces frigidus]|nr:hypothetical protein LTR85_004256 [Meristemomyces frigidus]